MPEVLNALAPDGLSNCVLHAAPPAGPSLARKTYAASGFDALRAPVPKLIVLSPVSGVDRSLTVV
jgi:hypothetical protein